MGDSENSTPADPYALLKIVLNPDGSLTRPTFIPLSPPKAESQQPHDVLSKDIPLNPSNKTWIRIFRPHFSTPTAPLPIIIYFHGGGFILFSAASAPFHASCERMATHVPAIVLSVEYRLAPEYPLPAAYSDAIDAVRWVRDQAISDLHRDAWMAPDLVDYSRCFLMGSSSGGNIVYHEFCNPIRPGAHLNRVGSLPPFLVRGHGGDPLVDRQRALVRMLEGSGVHVVGRFYEEGFHAIELFDPQKGQTLLMDVQVFISSVSSEPTTVQSGTRL